jgi:hypothetical protein
MTMAACALIDTGCVRRRFFVNTNPPGALVYADNQQIGTTPCAVDFTYYGTREIRMVKPGYETLTVNQPIPTPWYEFPPLDFISENLVPSKIRDNRSVTYNLSPQIIVPNQELLARAEQLRQETVVPAAAVGTPAPLVPVIPGVPSAVSPPFAPPPVPAPVPIGPPSPVVAPAFPATGSPAPGASTVPGPTFSAPDRGRQLVSPPLR